MAGRRHRRAAMALVLSPVTAMASPGTGASAEATVRSTSTPAPFHPCAEATERCDGTIEVPLDWSDPSSERIELAFALLPRTDQSRPAAGTVLANLGGGGPAIPTVPTLRRALGPVLDRHDLLVVDPRGMGRSSPLACPGLDLGEPGTIAACAERLGPRIQFFTADQHAADLDAVREALGLPQVTFYGNSYGTVFAQAYATRFPERVAGMFLDSVVPTDDDGYADPTGTLVGDFGPAFRMYDAICEISASCRRLPGTTRDRVAEVLQELRERPDPVVDSLRLVSLLAYPHDATFGRAANAALDSYLHDDPAPLRRISSLIARVLGPGEGPTDPGLAGMLAYSCADAAYPFDRSADPDERRAQLDRYYAEEQPFAPFTADELPSTMWAEMCVRWPTPRPSPVIPAGAQFPDVPVLIVSGEHDATTPPEGARSVADRFRRATFQEIDFGRHASALGQWGPYSQCVNATMRDFVAAPRYPVPESHCDAENYRALGTFPTRIREVSPARGPGLRGGTEGRIVAAAFATAQDAASHRNPYAELSQLDPADEEPGLRGGTLRLPADGTVQLHEVRYVGDLAVTGRIAFADDGTASAELHLADASRATLHLTWQPHQATDRIRITGTLDGRPFHATVPAT